MKKKHFLIGGCIFLICLLLSIGPALSEKQEREIIIVGQENQIYDIDAKELVFPFTVMAFGKGASVGRITDFSIEGYDLLSNIKDPKIIPIHQLDTEVSRSDFRTWVEVKRRSTSFIEHNISQQEEVAFEELNLKMRSVGQKRKDIRPFELIVETSELPFILEAETYYNIKFVVEVENVVSTWEGTVLIVDIGVLQTNPVWVPAQLHIHSSYSDGTKTPAQLASLLVNKGYNIAYITDETNGNDSTSPSIPATTKSGATWSTYSTGVRTYSANIAMFPGSEIAASTLNKQRGEHNGHALAYGINSFTGSSTFETTGLRYRWFLPGDLINNINNNRSVAHSSIAHPTHTVYPWNVWGSSLGSTRYHGFELMSGVQTNFGTGASPMVRWRSELTHKLPGVFSGLAFPSARTGSDYCGNWYSPDIAYYTFIGLDSPPPWSDLKTLSQSAVDTPLRKGRTVASRHGGMAAFTMKDSAGNNKQIGDYYSLASKTWVSSTITIKPTVTAQYRIRVVENNFASTIFDSTRSLTGGVANQITFGFTFDSANTKSNRYYHLIVEGSVGSTEYIYTSPIFIKPI
ncbi:MAG: hypothetical protein KGZ63_12935 [Clostridiales bacterium]|jgi:hypothetical protein|nr:hypothetical protein [Clostridiales bacterium]